jgi:hypothetical protein
MIRQFLDVLLDTKDQNVAFVQTIFIKRVINRVNNVQVLVGK